MKIPSRIYPSLNSSILKANVASVLYNSGEYLEAINKMYYSCYHMMYAFVLLKTKNFDPDRYDLEDKGGRGGPHERLIRAYYYYYGGNSPNSEKIALSGDIMKFKLARKYADYFYYDSAKQMLPIVKSYDDKEVIDMSSALNNMIRFFNAHLKGNKQSLENYEDFIMPSICFKEVSKDIIVSSIKNSSRSLIAPIYSDTVIPRADSMQVFGYDK